MYILLLVIALACNSNLGDTAKKVPMPGFERAYNFENGCMPENVLKSYLSRSITMAEFATGDGFYFDGSYQYKNDDIRMLKNIGAKFIGRSTFMWGQESTILNPGFLQSIEKMTDTMHSYDPDIIFQAAIFEIITTDVNNVPIPHWVFEAFGMPVEDRNFTYQAMLNAKGKMVDHWSAGASVPDIGRQETRMWIYYLAKKYIDAGIEAIHFGQVELMAMKDNNYEYWKLLLSKIRTYAKNNARRSMVLCDGHVPSGGMKVDGKLLLDFHSFPLRPKELPRKPYNTVLEEDYLDSFYGRSKGGVTPSGWETDHLPYIVEFDNFGISSNPGAADTTSHFVWGYDEITWFALQLLDYRNEWLAYAYDWIRETDPNGFLEMPGSRVITPGEKATPQRYRANNSSNSCSICFSQEETINSIWSSGE